MLQGATKASLADRIKGALHLGADNEVSPKKEHYTGGFVSNEITFAQMCCEVVLW